MPNYIDNAQAKTLLSTANRILVIGCSGGGKSTLSKKLAHKFALNLISIDRDVRWLPGWKERDKREQRARLSELIQEDRWIMDGSGASTFDIRVPRADLILWVRVPRHLALFGLARRVLRHYGKVRPMMAAGCPEPIPDREFISYIWNFEKQHAPRFISQIDLYGPMVPVCVLDTRKQINDLT